MPVQGGKQLERMAPARTEQAVRDGDGRLHVTASRASVRSQGGAPPSSPRNGSSSAALTLAPSP